jgi:NAD(P)-dependent dehydrogenase (short-subunit alcohol dehydrogenase family)
MTSATVVADSPVVLVTGAGKRLGRAIALGLAKAGWRVAVHYRHSVHEAQQTAQDCGAFTPRAAAFAADLSNEAQVRQLFESVQQHMGHIDAVVNSAALFEHDSADNFGYAQMQDHLRSNTGAAIVLAQLLHAHVRQRQSTGVVVNMLDQKLWNYNPDFFSYTLSKAALQAATTMLAQALAPQLRVVGVAPGLTLTSHMLSEEKFEQLHKLSPLGRASSVEDVVATVLFALTNQSVTGTSLLVDGGQHLMKFERDFSLM